MRRGAVWSPAAFRRGSGGNIVIYRFPRADSRPPANLHSRPGGVSANRPHDDECDEKRVVFKAPVGENSGHGRRRFDGETTP